MIAPGIVKTSSNTVSEEGHRALWCNAYDITANDMMKAGVCLVCLVVVLVPVNFFLIWAFS